MVWIVVIAAAVIAMEEWRTRRLKRLLDILSRLAQTDPLTGVLNRNGFVELADREFRRARRSGRPVTVAVLDVNDFGAVNTQHGRIIGDALLRVVAEAAQDAVRASDVVARVSGDEFAVLMPETGDAAWTGAVTKVRDAVWTATRYKGCPLTLSAGAVTCHENVATPDEILAMAEELMTNDEPTRGAGTPHQNVGAMALASP